MSRRPARMPLRRSAETRPPPAPDEENAPTTMFQPAGTAPAVARAPRTRPPWMKGTPTLPSVRDYRRPSRWPLFAGVLILALGAGALGAASHQVSKRAPVPPPEPHEVVIDVRATPDGARVVLDGQDVGAAPYRATVPKDGARRSLKIEAPGYQSWEVELRMDASIVIDASLDLSRSGNEVPGRK